MALSDDPKVLAALSQFDVENWGQHSPLHGPPIAKICTDARSRNLFVKPPAKTPDPAKPAKAAQSWTILVSSHSLAQTGQKGPFARVEQPADLEYIDLGDWYHLLAHAPTSKYISMLYTEASSWHSPLWEGVEEWRDLVTVHPIVAEAFLAEFDTKMAEFKSQSAKFGYTSAASEAFWLVYNAELVLKGQRPEISLPETAASKWKDVISDKETAKKADLKAELEQLAKQAHAALAKAAASASQEDAGKRTKGFELFREWIRKVRLESLAKAFPAAKLAEPLGKISAIPAQLIPFYDQAGALLRESGVEDFVILLVAMVGPRAFDLPPLNADETDVVVFWTSSSPVLGSVVYSELGKDQIDRTPDGRYVVYLPEEQRAHRTSWSSTWPSPAFSKGLTLVDIRFALQYTCTNPGNSVRSPCQSFVQALYSPIRAEHACMESLRATIVQHNLLVNNNTVESIVYQCQSLLGAWLYGKANGVGGTREQVVTSLLLEFNMNCILEGRTPSFDLPTELRTKLTALITKKEQFSPEAPRLCSHMNEILLKIRGGILKGIRHRNDFEASKTRPLNEWLAGLYSDAFKRAPAPVRSQDVFPLTARKSYLAAESAASQTQSEPVVEEESSQSDKSRGKQSRSKSAGVGKKPASKLSVEEPQEHSAETDDAKPQDAMEVEPATPSKGRRGKRTASASKQASAAKLKEDGESEEKKARQDESEAAEDKMDTDATPESTQTPRRGARSKKTAATSSQASVEEAKDTTEEEATQNTTDSAPIVTSAASTKRRGSRAKRTESGESLNSEAEQSQDKETKEAEETKTKAENDDQMEVEPAPTPKRGRGRPTKRTASQQSQEAEKVSEEAIAEEKSKRKVAPASNNAEAPISILDDDDEAEVTTSKRGKKAKATGKKKGPKRSVSLSKSAEADDGAEQAEEKSTEEKDEAEEEEKSTEKAEETTKAKAKPAKATSAKKAAKTGKPKEDSEDKEEKSDEEADKSDEMDDSEAATKPKAGLKEFVEVISIDSDDSEPAPAKRGRGRPKKAATKRTAAKKPAEESNSIDSGDSEVAPAKRGRGRPKKAAAKRTAAKKPAEESEDESGEEAGAAEAPAKRGRGRPKKTTAKAEVALDDSDKGDGEPPVKRKRGRPPKASQQKATFATTTTTTTTPRLARAAAAEVVEVLDDDSAESEEPKPTKATAAKPKGKAAEKKGEQSSDDAEAAASQSTESDQESDDTFGEPKANKTATSKKRGPSKPTAAKKASPKHKASAAKKAAKAKVNDEDGSDAISIESSDTEPKKTPTMPAKASAAKKAEAKPKPDTEVEEDSVEVMEQPRPKAAKVTAKPKPEEEEDEEPEESDTKKTPKKPTPKKGGSKAKNTAAAKDDEASEGEDVVNIATPPKSNKKTQEKKKAQEEVVLSDSEDTEPAAKKGQRKRKRSADEIEGSAIDEDSDFMELEDKPTKKKKKTPAKTNTTKGRPTKAVKLAEASDDDSEDEAGSEDSTYGFASTSGKKKAPANSSGKANAAPKRGTK